MTITSLLLLGIGPVLCAAIAVILYLFLLDITDNK
jgi:hypothetical protein